MINHLINQLVAYAYSQRLLSLEDNEYAINSLLYLLRLETFQPEPVEEPVDFFQTMEAILEYAKTKQIISSNSVAEADNFEGKLMDCFLPRPAEIDRHFRRLQKESPVMATNWFYDLSKATNYIKTQRIAKNITYKYNGKYAPLDITINLSKPEKDPVKIAKAEEKIGEYPKCALCMENVGYYGTAEKAPRANHRVVTISLGAEVNGWGFQYSPYSYFNEHCIVLKKEHEPMRVDFRTFCELIEFINQFPHYLIGSNAGLPVVGGSILSHYHFQGGRYEFPIEKAHVLKIFRKKRLTVELLKWPLSVVRVSGSDPNSLLDLVNQLFESWKNYSNESLGICAKTEVEHNTVSPIVKYENGEYHFYVVLRNNLTTPERPFGVFHPRESLFHIKKENIGLIEVMGLAVLPGRLQTELDLIKNCLLNQTDPSAFPELQKHLPWINELKTKTFDETTIDALLKSEVGSIFEEVLEDCGVFKEKDFSQFCAFVENAIR